MRTGNDPDGPGPSELTGDTFRWSLDTVIDPRGNSYEIDYWLDYYDWGTVTNYANYNYPQIIRYSLHGSESATRKRRLVRFEWAMRGEADHNDDQPTSYRSGFRVQITKRLTDIYVGTDNDGDDQIDDRIRRYQFLYFPKPTVGDDLLPPYSQLAEIQRYGKTDDEHFSTTFAYTRPERGYSEANSATWEVPSDTNMDFRWLSDSTATLLNPPNPGVFSALMDMNGDGFVDRVEAHSDGEWWVAYGPVTAPPAEPGASQNVSRSKRRDGRCAA